MAKILLGCLVGSEIPIKAVTAVRAILDFIYQAQYSTHDDDTLSYMLKSLETWEANKDIFVTLGTHTSLNIPKFHSLLHYVSSTQLFGATDNYNTETFERLHIGFAKKGWRASKKREEFPQMTRWLSRQENIQGFQRELSWVLEQQRLTSSNLKAATGPTSGVQASDPSPRILLPKHPAYPSKPILAIKEQHNIPLFSEHLRQFLAMCKPGARNADVKASETQLLPFDHLDVYYSFKFSREHVDEAGDLKDMVKASPLKKRFDTVVVWTGDEAETVSFAGTRIGRVKVLFCFPTQVKLAGGYATDSPQHWPKHMLAYVEWYMQLT